MAKSEIAINSELWTVVFPTSNFVDESAAPLRDRRGTIYLDLCYRLTYNDVTMLTWCPCCICPGGRVSMRSDIYTVAITLVS